MSAGLFRVTDVACTSVKLRSFFSKMWVNILPRVLFKDVDSRKLLALLSLAYEVVDDISAQIIREGESMTLWTIEIIIIKERLHIPASGNEVTISQQFLGTSAITFREESQEFVLSVSLIFPFWWEFGFFCYIASGLAHSGLGVWIHENGAQKLIPYFSWSKKMALVMQNLHWKGSHCDWPLKRLRMMKVVIAAEHTDIANVHMVLRE